METPVSGEVLDSFLSEARGYVPEMRAALESLEGGPDPRASLQELYRLAHNVRGAANVIGLPEIGMLAEGMEQLLEQVLEGALSFDEELGGLVAEGIAQIEAGLAATGAAAETPEVFAADGLVAGFLVEAEEHLQLAGPQLATAGRAENRGETLREIRRSIHTIKGAAAMVGLTAVSQLAHRMEDLLDQLWEGTAEFTPARHRLLTATYDALSDLVQAGGSDAGMEGRLASLYADYELALETGTDAAGTEAAGTEAAGTGTARTERAGLSEGSAASAAAVPAPAPPASAAEAGPDAAGFVRVPLERLDELMALVSEMFVQRSALEQHLGVLGGELAELALSQQRLRRLSQQLESQEAAFLPASAAIEDGAAASEFDALEFDRYSQIHLISRDLNETGNDVLTSAAGLQNLRGDFDAHLRRTSNLVSEAQEKLTRLRMTSVDSLAARLHRTVRVTAAACGKDLDLAIEGGATGIDQAVLAKLTGPLEHLLRNAVDHGIEGREARVAAGKPERGTIRLSAAQEGTDVVLRLSDDGRGLDEGKLRWEAVSHGFLSPEEAEAAPAELLYSFVFESGFSTAGGISEISGRGVGLDVVKAAVESLRGSVKLDSEPGRGTSFTLRLPMRMAIAKVLLVETHGQRYALPLQAVTEVGRVEARQWERQNGQIRVRLSGRSVPALDLAVQVGARDAYEPREGRLPVVALRLGQDEFALVVDEILDAREVAVKPLGGVLRRLHAVAGATILGDGSVVLILNPADLRAGAPRARRGRPRGLPNRVLDVLIVDDSLSVRRVVANSIQNTGWKPIQAKDGVEALEVLAKLDRAPDVMLFDVEMPRMDGFELTSRVRAMDAYRTVPIVMLTSRAGEKHRSKAFSLGVTDYLVKPYQDEVLLGTIRRLVARSKVA